MVFDEYGSDMAQPCDGNKYCPTMASLLVPQRVLDIDLPREKLNVRSALAAAPTTATDSAGGDTRTSGIYW